MRGWRRDFAGFSGGLRNVAEGADDIFVKRLKAGELDVGGGDLEAIEEEGGLAAVEGGVEDAAEHPLEGVLDGVGVFQDE